MSYSAIVTRITTRPHPNADRLRLGTCHGNQVVVGLDTEEGALGLFFPTDGQLSHEYCLNNGLYNASALRRLGIIPPGNCNACKGHGKLETHRNVGGTWSLTFEPCPECQGRGFTGPTGFFDANRRVRAQSFRKERSDGLWMPLESLSWAGADTTKLKEGDTLTEWGGYQLCQKYYTPQTLRALGQVERLRRREVKTFPKHDDTKQFRFVAEDIPVDSIIWITEKLHGTSGRYGHIWDEERIASPWRRILNYVAGGDGYLRGWRYLNGSKNVILERADARNSWYGTDDFRYALTKGITLHKGEVLYFEIVGWASETTPIMPPHDVTKTGLKDIREAYGDTIHYTYGCPRGEHRLYVYKILNVNPDGVARELTWHELVARCSELGLPHVPLLGGPFIHDGEVDRLREVAERFTPGTSVLSPAQIREGVVVRAEHAKGIAHIKNKQWAFGVLEGFWKEKEDTVDPEDIS